MSLKRMLGLALLLPGLSSAQNLDSGRAELQGIDDQVQTLKKEVIQINKELSLLEEKLLYPSTTQLSFFVSLEAKSAFRLDSIELNIDGLAVEKYIYTYRELEALHKGGVQRLHTGNVATGDRKLEVTVRGKTASGELFEKKSNTTVNKKVTPKFIELQVIAESGEPKLKFKDW